ncbi:P-loop containing nucleoside triphosphate hydrolase protein [Chaetomium tenue]|uniref:P-loop containing nucleoside triphosphate hydrolase protein n=1 Tax=Chaetomium tenue TaxID=1854479 RepID=A0ACB7P3Q0_9PEZI|nr:P-loop containing nucleoside triphosphate hydrolase protein [Chaetomium globosum]
MSLKQDEVLESLRAQNLQPHPSQQAANLPYYQLPFGRNPGFFGRTRILDQIREALGSPDSSRSIRSIALWGIGGIGKSQVALEYASQQVLEKCPLVLWIPAQTSTDMSRALVTAAGQVRPPGYEEDMTAEQMRFLMWNWLQTTETPWLIVFDNVDDNDLLTSNWPSTGHGQIVVTCRSELVAASPAAGAVEIPPFTRQEGGTLLLRLARKTDVTDDDISAAEELSKMLGGLALAIEITASQIFVKKKSLKQFLPYFKKHKQSLRAPPRYAPRNPYYSQTLKTVWQTAFESLDENSSHLLGLFCFFAPDDIPRSIINTPDPIPGTWPFLTDIDEYEEAEAQLLHMSLIKINEETEKISLHRLVQEAYYYYMTDEQRHETFGVAYRVLCEAFPKRELRRQMYQVWGTCELLIHHIEAAQDKYEELRSTGLDVQDPALLIMLADATWYFCVPVSR